MQWVYQFNKKKTDGNREMKDLLGGKGANLAEMASLGLSVPPGFTITTEACLDFNKKSKQLDQNIKDQVLAALENVEKLTGKKFGDEKNPLLFSVRSGAKYSMPGMMDTVLNLGMNDETVLGMAKLTGNPRFAWDSYRRFIQMYSNVVLGFNVSMMEASLEDLKEARGVESDTDLEAEDWQELVHSYKNILLQDHGVSFPQDTKEQLWKAIAAVFESWENPRAIRYRELNGFSHDAGTAVNIQSMVFGNKGDDSGTGVCFTRDPSTGEKKFFGEYLLNAQGEDVVAGIRTPLPINEDSKNATNKQEKTLSEVMPKVFEELTSTYQKLEAHYKDMQDIEFTIENGELFLLQTRNGKRTAAAALKIAVDMVSEAVITKTDAVRRIQPDQLNQLLHPRLDPNASKNVVAKGLPASPGAATGMIVFDPEKAHRLNESGKKVLLVRKETSPEDISGMVASQGILTARGGMTSHAAVVARGMGKPCIAGCSALHIDELAGTVNVAGMNLKEGDFLTIDGTSGEVIEGNVATIKAEISGDFRTFMSWADELRTLKVRTNADNPEDTSVALNFGAEGIGLCRTEHMFFDPERILAVREMIFSENLENRQKALAKLLPFQKKDFFEIFEVMDGKPVNIRLLDPPLHEFLPQNQKEKEELAQALKIEARAVDDRIQALHEVNPMLGHRGCRLGVTFPEIYEMQARAIAEAGCEASRKGIQINPEIMIPLVSVDQELKILRTLVDKTVKDIQSQEEVQFTYKIGTMIELPRAALTADKVAEHADFFSFGTNDLTQTTFGISRDDAGKFLGDYTSRGIFQVDPFVSLDVSGVGELIKITKEKAEKVSSKIHLGICGEHGGDPASIAFCHATGLEYVSCSPYRVPIARLAAAQAALSDDA